MNRDETTSPIFLLISTKLENRYKLAERQALSWDSSRCVVPFTNLPFSTCPTKRGILKVRREFEGDTVTRD